MVTRLWGLFIALVLGSLTTPPVLSDANSTRTLLTEIPQRPLVPALDLKDLTGKSHDMAAYKGRVVLVHFWATWCAPCRRELPTLDKAHRKLRDQGVAILAISLGEATDHVRRFLSNQSLSYPILTDPSSALRARWQVQGMPTTYVVDMEGRIVFGAIGERDWSSSRLLDRILSLKTSARSTDRRPKHR